MTAGSIAIPVAGTKYVAVYEISEGGQTREIQRYALNDSAGNEIPFPAALGANGGLKSELVGDLAAGEYEAVAASTTDQVLGATGGAGDYLSHVTVFPASTSPGVVTIKDGSTTIGSFPGGASSVSNLCPFVIVIQAKAAASWKITTGANVSAVAVGNFT